ncbi:MmcQ/YjbR family DNA-binding protein [Nakamurella flavida]|uniref:MmcQ/YjbR family DNA-binding protein n=1 Tax=Nakamurella flavida TaxID=363630 RepID=A0A939C3V1_9ACTN|nr:MmcQ/YjbR family DNA-binding protein [Nakamurella flavida]MBM9478065.1 MmcQ/YjbR family DNA-binding protein [Nakamurella flavida]MDP9778218.1 putative DNA-binding protein (MmcQ/YjbR family) [Nakamurella flavida]
MTSPVEPGAPGADSDALPAAAVRIASGLPDVTVTRPFGPDYDVGKVRGKVFVLTTAVPGAPIVTVKCEPEQAVALRAEFATITPGYHMNKRHWISVADGPGITEQLVTDLVVDAYLLVVEAMPVSRRPVLPDHLARHLRPRR